jgi:hypothetical protein
MHAASSSCWRPISEDWPPGGGGIDPLEGPHSLADNQPLDLPTQLRRLRL